MISLFQDSRSPIKQRSSLRMMSITTAVIAIGFAANPYIQKFSETKDRQIAMQVAESAQSASIKQHKADLEAADQQFQAEVEAKRSRRDALKKLGVGFVDGDIKPGEPILIQGEPGKKAPDNSVFENMEGDRAVVRNGKAVIIKKGSK